jgi:Malectin domain
VTFKFAEIYWSRGGQRAFNVSIEGKTVFSNLDLVAEVRPKTAYDVKIPVAVTDGVLNMTFTSVVGDAQVNGMVVTAK